MKSDVRLAWKYGPEVTNRKAEWRFAIKYNWDWTPWTLGEGEKWFGVLRRGGESTYMTVIAIGAVGIIWGKGRPDWL